MYRRTAPKGKVQTLWDCLILCPQTCQIPLPFPFTPTADNSRFPGHRDRHGLASPLSALTSEIPCPHLVQSLVSGKGSLLPSKARPLFSRPGSHFKRDLIIPNIDGKSPTPLSALHLIWLLLTPMHIFSFLLCCKHLSSYPTLLTPAQFFSISFQLGTYQDTTAAAIPYLLNPLQFLYSLKNLVPGIV